MIDDEKLVINRLFDIIKIIYHKSHLPTNDLNEWIGSR